MTVSTSTHSFCVLHWTEPEVCRSCVVQRSEHDEFYEHGAWGGSRPMLASWEERRLFFHGLRLWLSHPVEAFGLWRRARS